MADSHVAVAQKGLVRSLVVQRVSSGVDRVNWLPNHRSGRLGIRLSIFAIGRTDRRDVLIRGHFGDQARISIPPSPPPGGVAAMIYVGPV